VNKRNNKIFEVIGIMSGTSLDGIDFSHILTDGENFVKILNEKSYKYNTEYILKVKNFIYKIQKNCNLSTKRIEKIATNEILKKIKKFIKEKKIKKSSIDYIGLSGQTVLHIPRKKSIQIGSPTFIANNLKIKVISNFRENDIINGGEGAPIGITYHRYLASKIKKKIAIINIGGISNITYISKNDLIAFDTGPGNYLIDDYLWMKIKKKYDYKGLISSKGKINDKIINIFFKDPYFKKEYPKSLDRGYFDKYKKHLKKLNINDSVHTLSMITILSIYKGIEKLNKEIELIIIAGGGRKNLFFLKKLKEFLKIKIINIDEIKFNGDLLEAQAFGYIAVRSLKKLPLSFPKTTGVKKKITGGKIYYYI